jgi:hypothetical protein
MEMSILRSRVSAMILGVILLTVVATTVVLLFIRSTEPSKSREPRPVNATEAILKAFEKNQLVALGDIHGLDQQRAFLLSLIKNPKFTDMVQTLVIETGNARYQDVVDRYLNGEDVDMDELRKVWRDLSVSGIGPTDTMSNEELFKTIRSVNQTLAPSKGLHVYLGDPPVDWKEIKTKQDLDQWLSQRDTYFAGIVEKQIYAKGVKGLVIIGSGHLRRDTNGSNGTFQQTLPDDAGKMPDFNQSSPVATTPNPGMTPIQINLKSMLQIVEEKHSHTTYTIAIHTGFGGKNSELEPKLQSWHIPSILAIKGTWIGALDSSYDSLGSKMFGTGSNPLSGRNKEADIDGYLYLGPVGTFTITHPSPEIYKDDAYFNELNRRHILTIGIPLTREDLLKEKPTNFLENYLSSNVHP